MNNRWLVNIPSSSLSIRTISELYPLSKSKNRLKLDFVDIYPPYLPRAERSPDFVDDREQRIHVAHLGAEVREARAQPGFAVDLRR